MRERRAALLTERPAFGTQKQIRGSGGELKVREWFSPDSAVAHFSNFPPSGARVSSLILEPLLSYAFDGSLLPTLVTKVPTKENGGLSEDLTKVTLELREDVVWSDGEPFTAARRGLDPGMGDQRCEPDEDRVAVGVDSEHRGNRPESG